MYSTSIIHHLFFRNYFPPTIFSTFISLRLRFSLQQIFTLRRTQDDRTEKKHMLPGANQLDFNTTFEPFSKFTIFKILRTTHWKIFSSIFNLNFSMRTEHGDCEWETIQTPTTRNLLCQRIIIIIIVEKASNIRTNISYTPSPCSPGWELLWYCAGSSSVKKEGICWKMVQNVNKKFLSSR